MKNELVSVRPADPAKLRRSSAEQSALAQPIRPTKRFPALPRRNLPDSRATPLEPIQGG
jgi:hypothetical protein